LKGNDFMTQDGLTLALINDYRRTAEQLQTGIAVPPDTLNKYHGTTGILLAHVVQSLWSQAELEARIDTSLRRHIEDCPHRRDLDSAKPATSFRDVLLEHARLIIVCLTLVLTSAIVLGRVQEIAAVIDRVVMRSEGLR